MVRKQCFRSYDDPLWLFFFSNGKAFRFSLLVRGIDVRTCLVKLNDNRRWIVVQYEHTHTHTHMHTRTHAGKSFLHMAKTWFGTHKYTCLRRHCRSSVCTVRGGFCDVQRYPMRCRHQQNGKRQFIDPYL